jgi:hypothetical protein
MVAPYVLRLKAQIESAASEDERARLQCYLAFYWARAGNIEQAEAVRVRLREVYGRGKHPRISVLIMCAEALIHYYGDRGPEWMDRMRRAHVLSKSMGDRELIALTSAWLATFSFRVGNYSAMRAAIAEAIDHRDPKDELVRCRIAIIVASVNMALGRIESANLWHAEARQAALSVGDQAAIGAIIYNRAALQIHALRTEQALGATDKPSESYVMALAEVESAINYQVIARHTSLDYLLYIAKSGALILMNRDAEADVLIRKILSDASVEATPNERILLEADSCALRARSESPSVLREFLGNAENLSRLKACDPDEQLIAWSAIHRSLRHLDDVPTNLISEVELRLDEVRSSALEERRQLLAAIEPFASPV